MTHSFCIYLVTRQLICTLYAHYIQCQSLLLSGYSLWSCLMCVRVYNLSLFLHNSLSLSYTHTQIHSANLCTSQDGVFGGIIGTLLTGDFKHSRDRACVLVNHVADQLSYLQHNTMISHVAAAQHNGQSRGCSTTQSHGGSSSIT